MDSVFYEMHKALFDVLARLRGSGADVPPGLYAQAADAFGAARGHATKARAGFIRDQCGGFDGRALFQKYAAAWDFPVAGPLPVELRDMRNGFIHTFRLPDASHPGHGALKQWFLESPEALFARRLELWTGERGWPERLQEWEGAHAVLAAAISSF